MSNRCQATTLKGTQCTRKAVVGQLCTQHSKSVPTGKPSVSKIKIPVTIKPLLTELPPFDIQRIMEQLEPNELLNLMKTNKQMYQLGKPILDETLKNLEQYKVKIEQIVKHVYQKYYKEDNLPIGSKIIKYLIRKYVMREYENIDEFKNNYDDYIDDLLLNVNYDIDLMNNGEYESSDDDD